MIQRRIVVKVKLTLHAPDEDTFWERYKQLKRVLGRTPLIDGGWASDIQGVEAVTDGVEFKERSK